jgi:hypothetical protein
VHLRFHALGSRNEVCAVRAQARVLGGEGMHGTTYDRQETAETRGQKPHDSS